MPFKPRLPARPVLGGLGGGSVLSAVTPHYAPWLVLSLVLLLLSACQQAAPAPSPHPQPHASADSHADDAVPNENPSPPSHDEPQDPPRDSRPGLPAALYPDQALAPFVELGAMDSLPEESLEAFLVRVAQAADAFTAKTSHEACGVLMAHVQEEAWRVRLTTNRSHISCTLILFYEPGFERLGPDIHSHPFLPDGAIANAQDVLRNPRFTCGKRIRIFDERFSKQDMGRGPGYLVSRGRLLYQDGGSLLGEQVALFERVPQAPELSLSQGLAWGEMGTQAAAAAAWSNEDVSGALESWFPMTRCPDDSPDASVPASPRQGL